MKHFLKLIFPDKLEILFWFVVGLGMLIVLNVMRFTSWMKGNSSIQDLDLVGKYLSKLDLIDPRLVDFTLWILIGVVVFLLISVMIAVIKTAGEEASILSYYRSPIGRYHEAMVFLSKTAIRFLGVICAIFWFEFFINNLNPYISNTFYQSLSTIFKDYSSLAVVILLVLAYSAYLYLLAIITRIIALKIRVFKNEEFEEH